MATSNEPIFTLSQDIREEDIKVMATIGHNSFLNDPHTNIKKVAVPEKQEAIDDTGIRGWLSVPERCHVIKAVHNQTNEIMGYICWVHRGYVPRPNSSNATAGRFTEASEAAQAKTKIEQMEDMEGGHFEQFMDDIMPDGTKCWFVGGLSVDPKFQRRGVAKALLGWGQAKVDQDGVFAWVHSNEMAWQAYAACGFQTVRVLRTDLDAYAEGDAVGKGPGEGGKWGVYTVRYMAYRPENIKAPGFEVIQNVEDTPLS